jgi:uncharacterized protein YbaR (Trm112 family)
MIDSNFLKILWCPETHQQVRVAEDALVAKLNRQITAGTLRNCGGQPVNEPLDAGLIRADGKLLYPVRKNIPVMLIAEGISLSEVIPQKA